MSSPEVNFDWWERGVSDGIGAALVSAGVALGIIGETLDAGDPERARMLVSVYQDLMSVEGLARREDGRIKAIDLFLSPEYVRKTRRRARDSSRHPDSDQSEAAETGGRPEITQRYELALSEIIALVPDYEESRRIADERGAEVANALTAGAWRAAEVARRALGIDTGGPDPSEAEAEA